MNQDNGYIYFRSHQSFDEFDVYKIGNTNDIHKRDTQYVRDELVRGNFVTVFEVPIKKMKIIDRLIKNEFSELHLIFDGGTEFYKKKIITSIEPYLSTLNVQFKELTKEEINNLLQSNNVINSSKN
jgi:hypothetical protein